MSERGYSMVALHLPKDRHNVGGVLRAAHCFGARGVIVSGSRFKKAPTDTTKAWRHMPLIRSTDVFDALPYACVPVAVDILPNATPLPDYRHPERACYIFGAEDQTLPQSITERCPHHIVIDTVYCLNLAAAVNVVLYDRSAKLALRATDAA